MRRKCWILGIVAAGLIVTGALDAQPNRASFRRPRPHGPAPGVDGCFPSSGIILEGPRTPPVPVLYGLEFDPVRRWVWAATEASIATAGQPDIYMLDHTNAFQTLGTIVTDELRARGATSAQIDGPVDELALLGNGDLLCADFNGDLTRFDDTLFLLDPANPKDLKSVWYLDDSGCPGNCAKNGNTNVPPDKVDYVAGLAVRRTYEITATNQTTQEIFVSQYLPNAIIRTIELTPGTPGTWATRGKYTSPTGDSVDGLDWDPDLQSFWMTSTTTGLIYEVAFDIRNNSFRVIQSFPAQGAGGAIAVTAIQDSVVPHAIVEGEGFSFTGSIHMLDSGHVGRGKPAIYDPPGRGPFQIGIIFDCDCAGLPYRVLASGLSGAIQIGDRYLQLGVDDVLLWTLTDGRFAGTLNSSGAMTMTSPASLPPGVGPLYFAVVVFDKPEQNHLGLKRISQTLVHITR